MYSLVRRNPAYRLRRRRLDPRANWTAPYWDSRVAMPLDIEELEDAYVVKASVPGFTPQEIDINVKDNVLTIRAERQEEEEQEREGWHLRERFAGTVERRLRLSKNINGEAIEAELEHGVLNLTLPKVEEAKPKMIEVKAA